MELGLLVNAKYTVTKCSNINIPAHYIAQPEAPYSLFLPIPAFPKNPSSPYSEFKTRSENYEH